MTSCTEIMTSPSVYLKTFILRRLGAANFVDITKIAIMMTKTTIKNFLEKNVLKYNFYLDSSMY